MIYEYFTNSVPSHSIVNLCNWIRAVLSSLIVRTSPFEKVNSIVVFPKFCTVPIILLFKYAITFPPVQQFPKIRVALPDPVKEAETAPTALPPFQPNQALFPHWALYWVLEVVTSTTQPLAISWSPCLRSDKGASGQTILHIPTQKYHFRNLLSWYRGILTPNLYNAYIFQITWLRVGERKGYKKCSNRRQIHYYLELRPYEA